MDSHFIDLPYCMKDIGIAPTDVHTGIYCIRKSSLLNRSPSNSFTSGYNPGSHMLVEVVFIDFLLRHFCSLFVSIIFTNSLFRKVFFYLEALIGI